jgi:ribosomal protein S27AE
MINKQKPVKNNGKHLIISDATLEGISANDASKVELIYEPAATFSECTEVLTKKHKVKYNKVSLILGHTDCITDNNQPHTDQLPKNLSLVLEQAKSMSSTGDVQISSVLPQLSNDGLQQKVEELNSLTENVCNNMDITFVNNDPGFRLGDGEINDGFFQEDGFTLNKAGLNKLLKNLQIQNDVTISTKSTWNSKATVKRSNESNQKTTGPTKSKQNAPCWNCGESNHTSNICVHKRRLACHKCGKLGHKAHRCEKH